MGIENIIRKGDKQRYSQDGSSVVLESYEWDEIVREFIRYDGKFLDNAVNYALIILNDAWNRAVDSADKHNIAKAMQLLSTVKD